MLRDTGSSVRIYSLAKSLAKLGHEVHLVIPGKSVTYNTTIDGLVIHSINGICPKTVLNLLSGLLGVLRSSSLLVYDFLFAVRAYSIILRSDIIQIEQPWSGGLMIPLVKILKKPFVVDSHDVFQSLRVRHTSILRRTLEIFLERIAYKFADVILTVSKEDKEFLIRCGIKESDIEVLPNGVDTETFKPLPDATYASNQHELRGYYKVIFVGNMEYLPNQEAVRAIAFDLAPKIQTKINNVKFLIVGRAPLKLDSPNLFFTGVVKNLAEILASSDVAIAPLFHGSGTRLKLLEYFSCGLPVVSTTLGAQGLEVKDGKNTLIADDMNDFAAKVTRLLEDRTLSTRLGKTAREFAIAKYDWRKIGRRLNKVYYTLLSGKPDTN